MIQGTIGVKWISQCCRAQLCAVLAESQEPCINAGGSAICRARLGVDRRPMSSRLFLREDYPGRGTDSGGLIPARLCLPVTLHHGGPALTEPANVQSISEREDTAGDRPVILCVPAAWLPVTLHPGRRRLRAGPHPTACSPSSSRQIAAATARICCRPTKLPAAAAVPASRAPRPARLTSDGDP